MGKRQQSNSIAQRDCLPAECLSKAELKAKRSILKMIDDNNIDAIREVALRAKGGLVCRACRSLAWPMLAGVEGGKNNNIVLQEYAHHERTQIDLDLNRSLAVIPDCEREKYRTCMRRMILAALTDFGEIPIDKPTRYYYQGLHDISSILVIILGEVTGAKVLNRLLEWHLEPWMEGGSARMKEVLRLIHPLLNHADPELGGALSDTLCQNGMDSDYALPWLITWMTHNYSNRIDICERIVDFSLASSPIMTVYLCVAAALTRKEKALEYDEADMHYAMMSRIPSDPPLHDWIQKALRLSGELPPEKLVRMAYGNKPPRVVDPRTSPLFVSPVNPSALDKILSTRKLRTSTQSAETEIEPQKRRATAYVSFFVVAAAVGCRWYLSKMESEIHG